MNTKKTAFGIVGAAAATILTVGLAAPAMASTPQGDSSYHSSSSQTASYTALTKVAPEILNGFSNSTPVVISPSVGDVGSGNAIGSGNDVTAPLLSGNDTALASGNDTSVANGSGNGTSVGNGSGNANGSGNSTSTDVSNLVNNSTGSIGADVDNMVKDITGNLGLDGR